MPCCTAAPLHRCTAAPLHRCRQKKSQLNDLKGQFKTASGGTGDAGGLNLPSEEAGKPRGKEQWNLQRGEFEKIHEWYCTSLDGTHDSLLCARWRLRLKGAVEVKGAMLQPPSLVLHPSSLELHTLQLQLRLRSLVLHPLSRS